MPVPMEELHSLDPRRQELLEARFTGAVTGNTVGSSGSTSGGAKVTTAQKKITKPYFAHRIQTQQSQGLKTDEFIMYTPVA